MSRQLLISVGREFGSGGHKIAEKLAKELGISYYDRNILEHMFADDAEMAKKMEQYDEKTANPLITRRVAGYSNAMEDNLAEKEFAFIKEKAEGGESFVIVGRCGETILKDYPELVSFFVLADRQDKIERIMETEQLTEKEAIAEMLRVDRIRKKYHNKYSEVKWGDSRGYDVCINASGLGIDKTADVLISYIKNRIS